MSVLRTNVYANTDTPLWVENSGGPGGSLTMVNTQSISSGAKSITNGASVKFFNIVVPPAYQGKACSIVFNGALTITALASGTYASVQVGILCEFVSPTSGTTLISAAQNTATATNIGAGVNLVVSTSLVVVPKVGSTYAGIYVQNQSGVNISACTLSPSSFSIQVIDDTPVFDQAVLTSVP